MIMDSRKERTEIVFFDVETTVPTRPGQGFALLEFGAILVCPRTLEEVESYSTLVRPSDLSLLSSLSVRCNGITRDAVVSAPSFRDIADEVFELLQGRIWAGHNILRFDCIRVREAFSEIGRPAPEPKGTIDSLALLTQKFGRRAGDMKMASLATYFGLGRQVHRSLEDVRMNILVLKHCATVLFLESSLPDIFTEKSWVSPNVTTRSRSNGKDSPNKSSPSQNLRSENRRTLSSSDERSKEDNSLSLPSTSNLGDAILNLVQPNTDVVDSFDMSKLGSEITTQSAAPQQSPEIPPSIPVPEDCGSGFLEPEDVCIPSIHASLVPFYRGSQRMKVFHKDAWLQLFCAKLQVRFGLSTKFVDHVGRPRLSFVVDAHPGLCQVLDVCDDAAWRLLVDCGSSSEWRPTVLRKNGFFNSPTVRLNLPTVMNGNSSAYTTELYQKDLSGQTQKVDLNSVDPANLDSLLVRGTTVDAYFSLDPYDYQLHAGIRLVVKKLTVN